MKETLVILPGWGGTTETWCDFVNLAKEKYEVVCLNLPCFGDEPCPEKVWGVEEYSDFVKERIEGMNNITLLGHSFGGQLAAYLVAKNPKLVSKLVLSGAAVFRPRKTLRRMVFGSIAKLGKLIFKLPLLEKFDLMAKKALYRAADSPDYAETSGIKRDIFKKIIRQDFGDLLSEINVPTLVVWGDKDKYVPLKNGRKIADLIPNVKLEIIPNGRHGLHLQQPEKLLELINRF